MSILKNKVAIITGASSGIGRAAATLFAQEGAAVIVTARRQDALQELVEDISSRDGKALALSGDVRDESHALALVDLAVERFGGLDIAFNNAGTLGEMGPATDLTFEGWQETLDINLSGAFLGAKHQIPAMLERGGGTILFTSTFVGTSVGMPGLTAYASSKAGLSGLTKSLAAEFGPQGIRVNALLPGGTDTPMAHAAMPEAEQMEFARGLHALKRLAQPREIARAALFLASDAASFVTGAEISADGGASVNRT